MDFQLTEEQKDPLARNQGFVEVDGGEDSCAMLSSQMFREMMDDDDEYRAS